MPISVAASIQKKAQRQSRPHCADHVRYSVTGRLEGARYCLRSYDDCPDAMQQNCVWDHRVCHYLEISRKKAWARICAHCLDFYSRSVQLLHWQPLRTSPSLPFSIPAPWSPDLCPPCSMKYCAAICWKSPGAVVSIMLKREQVRQPPGV